MKCAFYWSAKKYSSEVRNGVFYEDTLTTYTKNATINPVSRGISITPDDCWRNNISYPVATMKNCTNSIIHASHESLQTWFNFSDNSLPGRAQTETRSTDKRAVWDYTSIDFMQMILNRVADRIERRISSGVNQTAAALTSAMTSTLRRMPINITSTGNTYGGSYGITHWSPVTNYVIHWKYLIFPAAILVLSTLFFFGAVFATWCDGIWKSSQLTLIFHGLKESEILALGNVDDHATMEDVGGQVRVELVETELVRKLQVFSRR
jgi:hypothetical protein